MTLEKKALFGNTHVDILPETRSARKTASNPSISSSPLPTEPRPRPVPPRGGPGQGQGQGGERRLSKQTRLTFKKLINCLVRNGKRGVVERMLFQCCAFIKIKNKIASRRFIHQAVHNVKPLIELRNLRKQNKGSRRQKAKAAPIPTRRAEKLAIQWIIEGAKSRSLSPPSPSPIGRGDRTMALGLYASLLDAYQKKGYAMKKKDDLHRACKLNILSQSGFKN